MKAFNLRKSWIVVGVASILFLVFVFIVAEALFDGKVSVKNNSDYDIEQILLYFESEDFEQTNKQTLPLIAKGQEYQTDLAQFDLASLNNVTSLTLAITFAGQDTFYLQSGLFYDNFDGNIDCKLSMDEDGDVILKLKASEGIFGSTAGTDCNDTFFINLTEGYVQ